MDDISSIGSLLGAAETSRPTAESGRLLSQEEFLKIMISELTNQDPLEPLDNREFLNQLTQLQTLEATSRLSEGIEAMLLGQQISAAGSLIGLTINGVSDDGVSVEGAVDRVRVEEGRVLLGLGEITVPLSRVEEVLGSISTEEKG